MKKTILLVFFLLVCNSVFSQTNYFTSPYKYLVGTSNPDSGWNQTEYDDAFWAEGVGGIGYGDITFAPYYAQTVDGTPSGAMEEGDTLIKTLITPTTSLYLRYPFSIDSDDTTGISGFSFETYFDDGFIAYMNGVEFARVNMGKKSDTAYFNTLTDRSHESQIAAGDPYPVAGYYINKKFLTDYLIMGENIIAVEVHNDSMSGSDLFLECSLIECLHDTVYDPLMSFWHNSMGDLTVNIRAKAYVEPDSSNLPLIIIESDEFGIPFSHVEVPASMRVIDKSNGQLNHPSDTSS